jgi:GTP pyrophosphokinase
LDDRFAEALQYAWELHRQQKRKMSQTPFFAHLMSVAGLVLDYGGSQQEAIAALLHDAVEDQGGLETLESIRRRFGQQVADIVEGCTDSFQQPKPPWQERKEQFLARLAEASDSVRLVCAADKIHNLRSLIREYRVHGEAVWSAFRGGREGTLWYYRTLLEVLGRGRPLPILRELADVWNQLEKLVSP